MIRYCFALLAVTFPLLLSGCEMAASAPPAAATMVEISATTVEIPRATEDVAPAEPAAAQSTASVVIPTPSGDTGVVHGIVLKQATSQPFDDGLDLFLAEVLRNAAGERSMAGLDRQVAPQATKDASGAFVFTDVAPGEYALIASSPLSQVLVPDMKDPTKDTLVIVEAGQSYDIGTVVLALEY